MTLVRCRPVPLGTSVFQEVVNIDPGGVRIHPDLVVTATAISSHPSPKSRYPKMQSRLPTWSAPRDMSRTALAAHVGPTMVLCAHHFSSNPMAIACASSLLRLLCPPLLGLLLLARPRLGDGWRRRASLVHVLARRLVVIR